MDKQKELEKLEAELRRLFAKRQQLKKEIELTKEAPKIKVKKPKQYISPESALNTLYNKFSDKEKLALDVFLTPFGDDFKSALKAVKEHLKKFGKSAFKGDMVPGESRTGKKSAIFQDIDEQMQEEQEFNVLWNQLVEDKDVSIKITYEGEGIYTVYCRDRKTGERWEFTIFYYPFSVTMQKFEKGERRLRGA